MKFNFYFYYSCIFFCSCNELHRYSYWTTIKVHDLLLNQCPNDVPVEGFVHRHSQQTIKANAGQRDLYNNSVCWNTAYGHKFFNRIQCPTVGRKSYYKIFFVKNIRMIWNPYAGSVAIFHTMLLNFYFAIRRFLPIIPSEYQPSTNTVYCIWKPILTLVSFWLPIYFILYLPLVIVMEIV